MHTEPMIERGQAPCGDERKAHEMSGRHCGGSVAGAILRNIIVDRLAWRQTPRGRSVLRAATGYSITHSHSAITWAENPLTLAWKDAIMVG